MLLPPLRGADADADPPEPRRVPLARRDRTRSCRCGPSCSPISRRRSRRYAKLVGDGPGFLLESVEHGERWSRFSFVGRDPVATLLLRDGSRGHRRRSPRRQVPTDRGMLAALEVLLDTYRAPVIAELPPLHGGMMGYLGYDVIREVERLPDVPPDDRDVPDAVMSMIGSLAAFDHWRQRVTLIESVPVLDARRSTRSTTPTTPPSARVGRGRRRPRPPAAVRAGGAAAPRTTRCPTSRASMPDGLLPAGGRGRPRSTSSPATSSRSCWPSASTSTSTPSRSTSTGCCARSTRARTCTSCATPELTIVGSSPEPMVQLLDGTVISRPIAGTRKRGEHRRARPAAWPPS